MNVTNNYYRFKNFLFHLKEIFMTEINRVLINKTFITNNGNFI